MKKLLILAFIAITAFTYCGKKPQVILPAADQYAKAKDLYERGKYSKAVTQFENLIYTYPGNAVIDSAQYFLGMCYYNDKDYGLAVGELKRLLSAYPNSEFADDAQYYIGMSHYKMSPKYSLDQSQTLLAIEEFNNLISNYPTSQYREDARAKSGELNEKLAKKAFKTGLLYLKLKDYKSAMVYFTYVRDNYSSTDYAIQSLYYSGEVQYKLDNYADAKETFENFLRGFSDNELAKKAKEKLEEIQAKETVKEG